MNMSFMGGKGLSTTQMLNLVMDTLYERFVEKHVQEFDGFNVGILDTFNTINMALPGKHYVAPSHKDVKDLFEQWKEANTEEKKTIFSKFINENVNLNKVDKSMMITALMAPPAAMVAKKRGQRVPQLTFMNAIPDVVFVPSATILALIAIKILRLMFTGKTTSKDATEPEPPKPPEPPKQPQPPQPPKSPQPPQSVDDRPPKPPQPTQPVDDRPPTPPEPKQPQPPQPPKSPQPDDDHPPTPTHPPEHKDATEPQPPEPVGDHPPTPSHPPEHMDATEPHPPQPPAHLDDHSPEHTHKDKIFCALCNKYH